MKNIKKPLLAFILFSFIQHTYTASTPAQGFSRANCDATIPTQGYGKFNESVSYDLDVDLNSSSLLAKHNMVVTTSQKNNCNTDMRGHSTSNPSGYRARAGYVDRMDSKVRWFVEGAHVEILDNGSRVMELSSAIDCNLVINQII